MSTCTQHFVGVCKSREYTRFLDKYLLITGFYGEKNLPQHLPLKEQTRLVTREDTFICFYKKGDGSPAQDV